MRTDSSRTLTLGLRLKVLAGPVFSWTPRTSQNDRGQGITDQMKMAQQGCCSNEAGGTPEKDPSPEMKCGRNKSTWATDTQYLSSNIILKFL